MLINTRVVWVRNPNTGIEGWRIKRIPSFDPVDNAAGLTHDILEHSRNDKGTWAEEVQAYGAMIAWRMDASDNLFKKLKLEAKPKALGQELGDFIENHWQRFNTHIGTHTEVTPLTENIHVVAHWAAYTYFKSVVDNYTDSIKKSDPIYYFLVKYLNIGFKRAMKVIEESGYHPGDLWSTVHDQINMYMFKQDYGEGTEVSIQIDTDRCWCRILPIREY